MRRIEDLREQVDITRAQLGDDEAFARLVERYRNRLLHYVRRIVSDEPTADDVLQETWLAAYRTLRLLRSPEGFAVWIYGIARHKALNVLRHQRRLPPTDNVSSEELEAVPDEALWPAFRTDEAALVHRCLDRISLAHREVLLLRFLEGMSYEEIAPVVGCAIGTVRSRLYYAKRALRRAMESEDTT